MDFDNLDAKLDAVREGQDTNDSDEQYPRVKLTPPAAIGGQIVDVNFVGDLGVEQNLRGASDWRDEGDFVFTIANPTVVRGTLFEALLRDEADENKAQNLSGNPYPFDSRVPSRSFRIVPSNWEQSTHVDEMVRKIDGEYDPVGVEILDTEFPGQPRDDFDMVLDQHERVDVFIGSQAGRIMAQSLDTMQSVPAFSEGERTQGMVEYPEDYSPGDVEDEDNFPRIAARPQLHPAVQDTEVALYKHFGDLGADGADGNSSGYRKHYGEVIAEIDGEEVSLTGHNPLDPTVEGLEGGSRYVDLQFHDLTATDTTDTSDDSDADGMSFDFGESTTDGVVTIDDLSDAEQEFVTQAVSHVEDVGAIDDAFGDFGAMVEEEQQRGTLPDTRGAEELRAVVERQAGA